MTWIGPTADRLDDRTRLNAWCESVGAAVVVQSAAAEDDVDVSRDGLLIATWNIHEGGGDLERFVDRVRRERAGARSPIIVLLQEVARADDSVPRDYPASVRAPGRIRPTHAPGFDIAAIATRLGMSLAYVPSMRNGDRSELQEDRGSAVLSTLPITDVVGIELPWVSQRRVAVMATVNATRDGRPWRLRAISVHLDNRLGRSSQARALARAAREIAGGEAVVIGGDLNSWFGAHEASVREIAAAVPRVAACGGPATFRFGLHLDHLFTTLPSAVIRNCAIDPDFLGSDHRPTVMQVFRD